ncbi:hypothetical protein VPH35_117933 [Triticum aestivum]
MRGREGRPIERPYPQANAPPPKSTSRSFNFPSKEPATAALSSRTAMAALLRWLWFRLGAPSKKAGMAPRVQRLLRHAAPSKESPWPDLPPELLGLVLLRTPSHSDRVHLRAVCCSWRSSVQLQPPPPLLSWFAFRDGTFLSLSDGTVRRLPVPGYHDVSYRVSTGSMFFLVHRHGHQEGRWCSLMNPFSGEITPLPINPDHLDLRNLRDIRKVVPGRVVAVLTRTKRNSKNVTVFAGGPQGTMTMEWAPPVNSHAADIATFRGKLYVLTAERDHQPELHVLDVGDEGIRSVQCIPGAPRDDGEVYQFYYYLVPSGSRLLLVRRIADVEPVGMTRFDVFQAVDLSGGRGRWSRVDTLMEHALFVSQNCSRSVLAGGQSCGGAREDCIYFMSELVGIRNIPQDFLHSGVYNMKEQTVARLPSETSALSVAGLWGPWSRTWLFPPEV